MKRLMHLSISVFFLSLTLLVGVHIGQQTAGAAPSQKVIGYTYSGGVHSVMLSNGDVFVRATSLNPFSGPPAPLGNFWQ